MLAGALSAEAAALDLASLEERLIRHEGLSYRLYVDTTGHHSIGVGRNLSAVGIRHDEAMLMLRNDMAEALKHAQGFAWFSELDPVRQEVVIEMVFNLGLGGFRKLTTLIDALERHDYAHAARRMRTFLWYRQVGIRGERLAQMMETGRE